MSASALNAIKLAGLIALGTGVLYHIAASLIRKQFKIEVWPVVIFFVPLALGLWACDLLCHTYFFSEADASQADQALSILTLTLWVGLTTALCQSVRIVVGKEDDARRYESLLDEMRTTLRAWKTTTLELLGGNSMEILAALQEPLYELVQLKRMLLKAERIEDEARSQGLEDIIVTIREIRQTLARGIGLGMYQITELLRIRFDPQTLERCFQHLEFAHSYVAVLGACPTENQQKVLHSLREDGTLGKCLELLEASIALLEGAGYKEDPRITQARKDLAFYRGE